MDLVAVNKDPALRHTPFGRLSVRPGANGMYLVSVHNDVVHTSRVINVVDPSRGKGVFDATHGKRPYERAHILRIAARQQERAAAQAQRELDDQSNSFKRQVNAFMGAAVDGKELLLTALANTRSRA